MDGSRCAERGYGEGRRSRDGLLGCWEAEKGGEFSVGDVESREALGVGYKVLWAAGRGEALRKE